jgi:hypothetical protein
MRAAQRLARGPVGGVLLVFVALTVASSASGCRSQVTLSHTLDSPEAVASAVVNGLQRRDLDGLAALALTEQEFRELVWPQLPTSRPERNIPWDYVWKDLRGKSRLQLRARLNEFQDRGFRVMGVRFTGETTDYETFRVHRASTLTLRDRDGHDTQMRLFGSMVEQDGRFKVFSYVVD